MRMLSIALVFDIDCPLNLVRQQQDKKTLSELTKVFTFTNEQILQRDQKAEIQIKTDALNSQSYCCIVLTRLKLLEKKTFSRIDC